MKLQELMMIHSKGFLELQEEKEGEEESLSRKQQQVLINGQEKEVQLGYPELQGEDLMMKQ